MDFTSIEVSIGLASVTGLTSAEFATFSGLAPSADFISIKDSFSLNSVNDLRSAEPLDDSILTSAGD